MKNKPVLLMILDGFGISETKENNGIYLANTKNYDFLKENYPFIKGNASGLFVGLPSAQMGNSEVGHLNIGAGRIVYQELTRITKSISDGDFFENKAFLDAMLNCKKNDSNLHLIGLVSDGGVHSHNEHLYALLKMAKQQNLKEVYVHAFLDGRDTPYNSAISYIKELEEKIKEIGIGKIATVMGRYFAMDRDNRWDRVKKAYDAIVKRQGDVYKSSLLGLETSYKNEIYDEFVSPIILEEAKCEVEDNDSIIFFNFRPDRARQLTRAFCDTKFNEFEIKKLSSLKFVAMVDYDKTIENKQVAFEKESIENTLGEYLSKKGLKQLRLAETEKYAHVTFFFNGGIETPYENEDRILVPSPKVATYDLKPEMSAKEVCENVLEALDKDYDFIVVNFANPDMVGHTGNLEAVITALETVDECIGKIYKKVLSKDGSLFICADHGNCETMFEIETKEKITAHTNNQVPFILVSNDESLKLKEPARLCDIAPTILDLMGLEKPDKMTGESMIAK